jgi:hypothetical protein
LTAEIYSRRGLARRLAGTCLYNDVHFQPLADRFIVSVESIAIRIEELGLFELDKRIKNIIDLTINHSKFVVEILVLVNSF